MLERGHRHVFTPVSVADLPTGVRLIHSRCNAVAATPANPVPACSLEEERSFRGDVCVRVRYRFGGVWFSALDLLRLLPIPVEECDACHGEKMLVPCESCGGSGLQEPGGGVLAAPDLRVTA